MKYSKVNRKGRWAVVVAGVMLNILAVTGTAQESTRPSLTGSTASEMRRPPIQQRDYNLKAGPVTFDLRGALGVEYNDNVYFSDSSRTSDFILRPEITLNSYWQATKLNSLSLDLSVGYAKYLSEDELDTSSILIAPNSQLSFDIFAGDFLINLHDRFSITQDPIGEGTLSNVADFTRFENAAGVSVLWDLNDVKLVLGYDFYTFKAITENFSFLDRLEHQFIFSAAFALSDEISLGLDAGAAAVDFDESFNNDAFNYQFGPFFEMQLSNYLKLRVSAGYQAITFDSGGSNGDQDDASGPYASLTVVHRFNNYFNHELSVGYETRLGLTTNFVEMVFTRYQATWQMNRLIALRGNAFFEDFQESAGFAPEEAQRYGAGLSVDFQLTVKSRVSVEYQFICKDSELADRDYYQNRVNLRVAYNF